MGEGVCSVSGEPEGSFLTDIVGLEPAGECDCSAIS